MPYTSWMLISIQIACNVFLRNALMTGVITILFDLGREAESSGNDTMHGEDGDEFIYGSMGDDSFSTARAEDAGALS